jgi:hypothetical protein
MASGIRRLMRLGLWCAFAAAVFGRAIAAPQQPNRPDARAGGAIHVDFAPVPLNPQDPSVTRLGDFAYAGGLVLTTQQTTRLHELSDIVIGENNRIVAVGDGGIFFEARLILDRSGTLVGLTDATLTPLIGENGKPLTRKAMMDAEGLTILPNGDRLVSFERRHRIWLYPKDGGPPHAVPSPRARFPSNEGMEALTAVPDVADDAYMVGGESSGETWTCRISTTCVQGPTIQKPKEFGLVSMHRLPDATTAYLLRAYDPVRRSRIRLLIIDSTRTVIARMDLAPPLTVDNFEGLTSTPIEGGRRFYLVSDDNANASQRTLLLAFDWRQGTKSAFAFAE